MRPLTNKFFYSIDPEQFDNNSFQRISIAFEDHSYVICLSNKKVYVVKKRNPQQSSYENIDSGPTSN